MVIVPTCEQYKSRQAGKSWGVQVQALEVVGEVSDGVQPLSEPTKALEPVQHQAVTEH